MANDDMTGSTPPEEEDPGYLTRTGEAVGEDGSVAPIIGGLPAVEGSAWDIGAPVDDRGGDLADERGSQPGQVNRSAEVEALAVRWMALLKAGDIATVSSLIGPDEATILVGTGPADWYPSGEAAIGHLREALASSGGLPFEPGAPKGWAHGDVGWFADRVTLALPGGVVPLRMTGVAIRQRGQWHLVQVHLSAAVTDEALLAG